MSTRAYRINKIESENDPSFNLTWHENLMEYFHNGYVDGILDVEVEELEEALKDEEVLKEIGDHVETLKADIEWAKSKDDTIISYLTC
jgi:hypothetical protein